MSGYTYFVSHAGPDSELAGLLVKRLEELGHKAIDYVRDFPKDSDFVVEITEALVKSDYVIALMSDDYLSSNWCMKEYRVAYEGGKLIPVIVKRCNTSNLPAIGMSINVRGMKSAKQVESIVQKSLGLQVTLSPQPVDWKLTNALVERTTLVIAQPKDIFSNQRETDWFSQVIHRDLDIYWLKGENVEVIIHPKAVSKEEASKLLRHYGADFVLYGQKRRGMSDVGIVYTRGWLIEHARHLPAEGTLLTRREDSPLSYDVLIDTLGWILMTVFANLSDARGNQQKSLGFYKRAISRLYIDEPYEIVGDVYTRLYLRSRTKNVIGDWDGAIEDLTRLIKRTPPDFVDPNVYAERAESFFKLRLFDLAFNDLNVAIMEGGNDARLFRMRGHSQLVLGYLSDALSDLNVSIKMDPKDAQARFVRGVTLSSMGSYLLGIQDYTEALRLKPDFPEVFVSRGLAYETVGNWKLALDDYELYAKLGNNNPELRKAIARVRSRLQKS